MNKNSIIENDFSNIHIIVDAFGGDFCPNAAVEGSRMAIDETNVKITLCGNEKEIKNLNINLEGIEILNATETISQDEMPTSIQFKPNSSMHKGLSYLSNRNGDAFLSSGNSGALLVGTTLIVKRDTDVKRIAFGAMIPSLVSNSYKKETLLLDCGANSQCTPSMLESFALLGTDYLKKYSGISEPKVALLNTGTEKHKGDNLRKETYILINENSSINFIGNIESDKIFKNSADIIVTDGFVGNILLKTIENIPSLFALANKKIEQNVESNEFEQKFNYKNVGASPLLGASKPVFKTHGKADAISFKNAICNICYKLNNKL